MAAKHPPTFDCLKCNKQYNAQFALEDHYRGHTAHPNCTVCGRGFYDSVALDAHIREVHIDLRCDACNLQFESVGAAIDHYTRSPAHPNCVPCGVGFRDAQALEKHMAGPPHAPEPKLTNGTATPPDIASGEVETPTGHSPPFTLLSKPFTSPPATTPSTMSLSPPLEPLQRERTNPPIRQPTATQGFISSPPLGLIGNGMQLGRTMPATSYSGTGFSPLSPRPNIFSKDLRRVATIDTTTRVDSPDLSQTMNLQVSPLLNVQAPIFSPLSLPKPGRQIDELWSSRENVQIAQNRIPKQPSLPASVPSATSQAGPTKGGAPPLQQIVPYTNYRYQVPPPRHRAASDLGVGAASPPDDTSTTSEFSRHTPTMSEPRFTARAEYNFNPRLYPGSARHTTAQSLTIQQNSRAIIPIHKGNDSSNVGTGARSPDSGLFAASPPRSSYTNPLDFGFCQPTSLLSLPLPPSSTASANHRNWSPPASPPFTRPQQISEDEENKWKDKESDILDYSTVIGKDQRQTQSFKDEISILSAVSTPRLVSDAPLHEFGVKPGTSESPSGGGGVLPSPSDFSSISSVSSGVPPMPSPTPVGRKEKEPNCSRSRAASLARSDISSLNIPEYRVTASSEQATPVSPDVVSPIGLAALPMVSPLAHTPIDVDGVFDIPEARQPLPDSIPPSPITVCETVESEEEEFQAVGANEASSGTAGAIGELGEEKIFAVEPTSADSNNSSDAGQMVVEPKSPSSPSSPQSFMTSHQELAAEEQETPKKESDEDYVRSISRATSMRSALSQAATGDTKRRNTPDLIVKSPSPSPFSVTPKDNEGSPTLPEFISPTVQAPLTSPKRQYLVAPPLGFTPNTSIASSCQSDGSGGGGTSPSLPLLHCRACRRETPDDITATMCGHVFCNRCITDAIIKTSRCPFCSTPTLLYCLFRLDLAT